MSGGKFVSREEPEAPKFLGRSPTACEHRCGMRVICAWCEAEGHPVVLDERAPLDDLGTTHTICPRHKAELLAQVASSPSPRVQIFLVVPAGEDKLQAELTKACAGLAGVNVIMERRAGERRQADAGGPPVERRRLDRRQRIGEHPALGRASALLGAPPRPFPRRD